MEKQFKTAEEQLEHIRRLDRERQKRSALAGNRNIRKIVLVKEDDEALSAILAKLDCTFPQMIRRLISGEYEIHLRDENKQ
jgi:hypothetical protein